MSETQWLRFIPFLLASLVLFGWSMIVIVQTRKEDWDFLNIALAGLGICISVYLGSLAVDYGLVKADPPAWYYDIIRIMIGIVSFIGIGPTYVNLFKAIRARRDNITKVKHIYNEGDQEPA